MPRSSTVYDLTSLQVHADGRRVRQKKDPRPVSLVSKQGQYWVATDAGGLPSKHSRRKSSENTRKYGQGMEYLSTDHPPVASSSSVAWSDDFPSSELLKNIHYFASQYYSTRGQLYNHAQQVRKEAYKKKRQREDGEEVGELEPEGSFDQDVSTDEDEIRDSPLKKGKSRPRSNSRSRSLLVRQGILEKLPPQKGKYKRITERRKEAVSRDRMGNWEPDMYKMMGGSALVCLGMLMQEFVRWQVRSRIPEDWKDEEDQEGSEEAEAEEDMDAVGVADEIGLDEPDEGGIGSLEGVDEEADQVPENSHKVR